MLAHVLGDVADPSRGCKRGGGLVDDLLPVGAAVPQAVGFDAHDEDRAAAAAGAGIFGVFEGAAPMAVAGSLVDSTDSDAPSS